MKYKPAFEPILAWFEANRPLPKSELNFLSPYQLIVAVILSAQCTDKRVNQVTPELFRRYPDAHTMAQAEPDDILEYISSVSYPNSKSRHLAELSRILVQKYNGEVPGDFDALLKLPGVGRKTANVMQAVAFGKKAMAVDTHVYRVSHRLGLVPRTASTPLKVEQHLLKHIPTDDVPRAHHWLLLHGRYVCTSRAPHCDRCSLEDICPKRLEGSRL